MSQASPKVFQPQQAGESRDGSPATGSGSEEQHHYGAGAEGGARGVADLRNVVLHQHHDHLRQLHHPGEYLCVCVFRRDSLACAVGGPSHL